MASAGEDGFTFPAPNSQPHFITSPPLWRHLVASRQSSQLLSKGEREEEEDRVKPNVSLIQEFKASSTDRKENTLNDGDEERMDMLWEDLNDELSRNSGKISQNADASSPGRPAQVRCIKAMKLSKANGHVFPGKKSNILVFIKIVKRAFAIHNTRRSINKHGKYF